MTAGAAADARSQRPRLLFVLNEAYFFLSHRLSTAQAAAAAGFEVHVAAPCHHAWAPAGFSVGELKALGFQFHAIPMSRRGINPFGELHTFVALCRLYRRLRPDIVHHVTIKANLYGGLAARLTGVPAALFAVSGLGQMFVARDWRMAALRAVVARALALAFAHPNSIVICQNASDRQTLIDQRIASADDIVILGGAGVDLEQFRPLEPVAGNAVVILAARLIWDKGIDEFVQAARLLKERGVPVRMVLVGRTHVSNPRAVSEEVLRGWVAEGVVEWWGFRTDMAEVLGQSHVVCLPSSYGEGVPKVLLEAAACGRPIVTTDIPGCRDVVTHGENGYLVPPRDAVALADALAALAADRVLRDAMGQSSRLRAERRFDQGEVAKATVALYNDLFRDGVGFHRTVRR